MDIAGAQAQGFQDDAVDQADGRGFLGAAQQLFEGFAVLVIQHDLDALVGVIGANLCGQFVDVVRRFAKDLVQLGLHLPGFRQ